LIAHWLAGLWRTGPRGWADAATAAAALFLARNRLQRSAFAMRGLDLPTTGAAADALRPDQRALVERVRLMIPRVANRLGWPRDCLIQALAAQAWLARRGISSRIVFGGRNRFEDGFDAHAWLLVGTREVTGWNNGEAASYARFPARSDGPVTSEPPHDI
jgi:hypothetical protein